MVKHDRPVGSKPRWLKTRIPSHPNYFAVLKIVRENNLHTICQSARCPNIGHCWAEKTATFLIMGDICTRNCSFCAVAKGTPRPLNSQEPESVAKAVRTMGLKYAVITSVTRDDLPDGGALHFAQTIKAIRKITPQTKVEVLIPDFQGVIDSLKTVLEAQPDVLNHNLEVPERIYPRINRPPYFFKRSLEILQSAKEAGLITKSGLMVGLGETEKDLVDTFEALSKVACDLLTIGQYLQPTKNNYPVIKYYSPREFDYLKKLALDFGFQAVESGPLVRSSYHAAKMADKIKTPKREIEGNAP
ncbi:MAG: lipoyl synthase [Candidatus Aminicenantes bacterium 4484_214]|nr:MAG: lipoyl synthase [Candidatus Aminicenantes bacterium 4484_214]